MRLFEVGQGNRRRRIRRCVRLLSGTRPSYTNPKLGSKFALLSVLGNRSKEPKLNMRFFSSLIALCTAASALAAPAQHEARQTTLSGKKLTILPLGDSITV